MRLFNFCHKDKVRLFGISLLPPAKTCFPTFSDVVVFSKFGEKDPPFA